MPYRALLWTMMTVAVALVAVAMWVRAVEPLMVGANEAAAASRPGRVEAGTRSSRVAGAETRSAKPGAEAGLRRLVHGTLLLSFVLICMLLVVGMASTFREWVRYRTAEGRRGRKGSKTVYVDAWKIAGERMKAEGGEGGGDKGTG